MTVSQYRDLFYRHTKTKHADVPPALILEYLNQAARDFVAKTFCIRGTPVTRLSLEDEQEYSLTAAKLYLDADSGYKWTASGAGTNEYYCELAAGGDPSLSEPDNVHMDGVKIDEGTLGALADHEWAYGDNDSLGYDTMYIRDDSGDPDTEETAILLEPGGFEITRCLRLLRFQFNDVDYTDNELDVSQIKIGSSSYSVYQQYWAQWEGTLYLDPIPAAQYTMRVWPALYPATLSLDTDEPEFDSRYHPILLHYVLWKFHEELRADPARAKDFERQYREGVQAAIGSVNAGHRSTFGTTRRVFP